MAASKSIIFRNSSHLDLEAAQNPEMTLSDYNSARRYQAHIVPYASFLTAHRVSALLYYMQLASALVCVGLSLARLCMTRPSPSPNKNQNYATGIFYSLILAEALIFLVERSYWEYQIGYKGLVATVDHQLGTNQVDNVKRFFYEVYSTCLKGSVFDGLDLDLVSYGMGDIQENNGKEQLGGASILLAFLKREDFAEITVRRIGTKPGVMERLLEMLTWKEKNEVEIRRVAAQIICHAAYQKNVCFKIVAISGALESIASLLHEHGGCQLQVVALRILKRIASDQQSCIKIGNTGGLLSILIRLIEIKDAAELTNKRSGELKALKKSLQILRLMATTPGYQGKLLRSDIANVVFTIRHLSYVLEYAQDYPVLQELSLDIITNLALEDSTRENIGSTGGIFKNILQIFLAGNSPGVRDKQLQLRVKAGEALNLLALRNPRNCWRMCRGGNRTVQQIIEKLRDHPKLATRAAKVLRNLCMLMSKDEAVEIAATAPKILKFILETKGKELEAALGLAAATVPHSNFFLDEEEGINFGALAQKLAEIVSRPPPTQKVLRLRRYGVELITALALTGNQKCLDALQASGIGMHLSHMLDTISDVENFYTFSGDFGLTRHFKTMEELVNQALEAVQSR